MRFSTSSYRPLRDMAAPAPDRAGAEQAAPPSHPEPCGFRWWHSEMVTLKDKEETESLRQDEKQGTSHGEIHTRLANSACIVLHLLACVNPVHSLSEGAAS